MLLSSNVTNSCFQSVRWGSLGSVLSSGSQRAPHRSLRPGIRSHLSFKIGLLKNGQGLGKCMLSRTINIISSSFLYIYITITLLLSLYNFLTLLLSHSLNLLLPHSPNLLLSHSLTLSLSHSLTLLLSYSFTRLLSHSLTLLLSYTLTLLFLLILCVCVRSLIEELSGTALQGKVADILAVKQEVMK